MCFTKKCRQCQHYWQQNYNLDTWACQSQPQIVIRCVYFLKMEKPIQ